MSGNSTAAAATEEESSSSNEPANLDPAEVNQIFSSFTFNSMTALE